MFVDFDNVYSLLQRLDADAAKLFAEDPARWVTELTSGTDQDGAFTRRFLVQKCYLNPAPYSRYRPNFTRAGFQVVDCPSLTQQGKSSADINLVLDAMDALASTTRFDEFVFLSADADFTPLVIRCRAADRQVTIVTPGPAAAAYRAVADTVLSADMFIGLLTGSDAATILDSPAPGTSGSPSPATPGTPTTSDTPGTSGSPAPDASGPAATAAAIPTASAEPAPATPPVAPATPPVRSEVPVAAVHHLVRSADRPVALAAAAAEALRADPTLRERGWDGAGTFAAWLQRSVTDLAVDTRKPGYVWDPARFQESDLPQPAADEQQIAATAAGALAAGSDQRVPGLTELQRRVVALTETPGLAQAGYRCLLEQLDFDLALHPFSRNETSKRVRDACAKVDVPIGRAAINFVINGLLLAGAGLDGEPSAEELAAVWTDNVLGLCRGARIELSAADVAEITEWVSGGLVALDPV